MYERRGFVAVGRDGGSDVLALDLATWSRPAAAVQGRAVTDRDVAPG